MSEPEDESVESKTDWKMRMAQLAEYPTEGDVFECMRFLEVLKHLWLSNEGEMIEHELHGDYLASISPEECAQEQFVHVYGSGHLSSQITKQAPYKFQVNRLWYNENKDKSELASYHLEDWESYNNPEGFGSRAPQAGSSETHGDKGNGKRSGEKAVNEGAQGE
ncbi:hypothetical protein CONPUDRAFT_72338 [Coniophora puteana RWD-64-598 SS2]|uniref:Uncharacterized protein n=1 Tax=Coniophora puteana (strain RWD-64-598) TaxID=741705 RepID=A0A5M3MTB3_CONPW|nr:uncharacterized protein CONPUDRAFT_72338 [Coniophora puteana RWD-64-598 SS2]EIW81994.1 hypothetical protein CONPUDRAFT_72338 [Coniophora puteana RWD-64-598 SS2]